MYPLTKEVPKPLLPVEGKPVLLHLIEMLRKQGIIDIVITAGYLADQIKDFLGDGSRFGVKVEYLLEREPMGTAGVLSELKPMDQTYLMMYGDVMVNMDLHKLLDFHQRNKSQVTLVVHPSNHPQDSDVVCLDKENKVTDIVHRPTSDEFGNVTSAALYVLDKEAIAAIPRRKTDFAKDLFPVFLKTFRTYGYTTPEYLKDMGTPERYQKVCEDVRNGTFARGRLP
jgi:NDP-sugar pyrophosphorylase family protein